MKEINLSVNLAGCSSRAVNALVRRLNALSESKFGVLSGNVIWFELLDRLGIDAEKTILESFEIGNLKDNIYGIELVDLYKDPSDNRLLLSFKINDSQCHSTCDNEEDFDADVELEAEAFAKIYAKLNSIQEKTGVKIAATVTTDGISLESSRGHLIYRIMIPKYELDGAVDIVIPIDNALNTAIKKMMD